LGWGKGFVRQQSAQSDRDIEERFMAIDFHSKAKLLFVVILCAAALAAGLWYLRSSAQYTTYRIETHDPVSGLIVDSPVELHGVEVGSVTKIELTGPQTVGILLRVVKGAPVSKATVATIIARGLAARGFTGYVYVALENTSADSGPLTIDSGQHFPVIPTAPSLADTMDTTVADAVQQVRLLTRLLQSALDEKTVASLKQSVDEFQKIMATLAANNERLGSLIVNTERDSRNIGLLLDGKTIESLKRSVGGLQKIMATLTANDARLGSLIVNAERDSRELRPLLETSDATLGELHEEVLPQLHQTLDDLNGLTHSLNGLAEKIAKDPSVVIRGTATLPGPGER
jgi:phospholipid/cholesterol/gamma-HCH transport system substrate-binding protein